MTESNRLIDDRPHTTAQWEALKEAQRSIHVAFKNFSPEERKAMKLTLAKILAESL